MSPLFLALLVAFASATAAAAAALDVDGARGHGRGHRLKSRTFLSPPFSLRPGSVSNKWYMDVAFPRGHLALKSFDGEVVDARGAPVPLHETYLHHWLVVPYYPAARGGDGEGYLMRTNSGVCRDTLGQYFGLGAETRHTATRVPDPYGIEVGGDPPPEGYGEERWALNVHAIDTRGAADRHGCTECRCDLYNVTVDEEGSRIGAGYSGGTRCCYDQTRCRVEEGFVDGEARELFLRYTVMWVDWSDAAVVPVRIYILDVADDALLQGKSEPDCQIEYTVEECSAESRARNDCVDVKVAKEVLPRGGDVVYAVGHQHAGGTGTSLHGEDGRLLCWSTPTYGSGHEAGNEAGYVVGMSACYPAPGAVRVRDGEALTVVSNYTGERRRTGVMGHFYLLVADEREEEPRQQQQRQAAAPSKRRRPSPLCFSFPVPWCAPAWLSIGQPAMEDDDA